MGEAREDIGSMLYDKFSSFIARYWYLTISKTELWIILLHNHMKYFYYESWEKTSSYSKHNIPSKNSGWPKNPPYPLPFNFEYFDPKNEPNAQWFLYNHTFRLKMVKFWFFRTYFSLFSLDSGFRLPSKLCGLHINLLPGFTMVLSPTLHAKYIHRMA